MWTVLIKLVSNIQALPWVNDVKHLFIYHLARYIFSALDSVKRLDNIQHCPNAAEYSCNICASYQCLIPHLLYIIQTTAYSVTTLQTHIIWIVIQCNSVINNECWLTEGLTVWGMLHWSRPFLCCQCSTEELQSKWIRRHRLCACVYA